jgi:hypothetical protein
MCFLDMSHKLVLFSIFAGALTGCGGGGGSAASNVSSSIIQVANEVEVTVDNGPAGYNVNRLYTDVTICTPGTLQCQTIDHVLVDTGSSGLRILASELSANVNLPEVKTGAETPLLNCLQFLDNSFAWGSVVTADVVLGGKTASAISVQVIGNPAFDGLSGSCASGVPNNTLAALGARGILGVGINIEDCGVGCIENAANGYYFKCADATCSAVRPSAAALSMQVKNPVSQFAQDNNGLSIELPAASAFGQPSLVGKMVFGVGTQVNSTFTPGATLPTNKLGYIRVNLDGRVLNNSFIDTGSNALYFDSSTLPLCTGNANNFFCPVAATDFTATLFGSNFVQTSVQISIANAADQFVNGGNTVLPRLAGPSGDSRTFDGGLPFFYGRRVVIGFAGKTSPLGIGPYYAF